jgi:hypothetical protein
MIESFLEQINSKTDDELMEIYVNEFNYQPSFVELAREELVRRVVPYESRNNVKVKKEEIRKQELLKGQEGSTFFIILIGVFALVGGPIGIIGGGIYAFSKNKDVDGEKYYAYDQDTRKWGRIIFFIGISVLAIALINS